MPISINDLCARLNPKKLHCLWALAHRFHPGHRPVRTWRAPFGAAWPGSNLKVTISSKQRAFLSGVTREALERMREGADAILDPDMDRELRRFNDTYARYLA